MVTLEEGRREARHKGNAKKGKWSNGYKARSESDDGFLAMEEIVAGKRSLGSCAGYGGHGR